MPSLYNVCNNISSSTSVGETLSDRRPQHEVPSNKIDVSLPKMTLSAFRRDEESIRVVDPNRTRKLSDLYKLNGVIGYGAMSIVRLAVRRSDNYQVAIKSVSKHDILRSRKLGFSQRHLDEWEALRMLKKNVNVIDLIDVFETNDEIHMVLEYCSGGELFDVIEKKIESTTPYFQNETEAASIIEQVLAVLSDLHGRGMVHRDIKPENLLLSMVGGGCVKLCDFGVARLLFNNDDECKTTSSKNSINDEISPVVTPDSGRSHGKNRAYSNVGSDLYTAPEICLGKGYDTAVDMYSLGVTLYILLCGFPPVFGSADNSGDGGVSFPGSTWSIISEEAKDLIRFMLRKDPEQRVTADKALQSNWIRQHSSSYRYWGTQYSTHQESISHLFLDLISSQAVDLELVKSKLNKSSPSSESKNTDRKRKSSFISSKKVRKRRQNCKELTNDASKLSL